MESFQEASTGLANVRIFDPIGHFCDKEKCYTEQDGVIFYIDHDHISPKKALALLSDLKPCLMWMAESRNTSDAEANNRAAVGSGKPKVNNPATDARRILLCNSASGKPGA